MKIDLVRLESSKEGTFGVLLIKGKIFCMTLENPWKDNEPNVSCVPTGIYCAEKINSPKFGLSYELKDVQGRTHIIFGHVGNSSKDTLGCMLFGQRFGSINDIRGILNSRDAMKEFNHAMLGITSFAVHIRNAF